MPIESAGEGYRAAAERARRVAQSSAIHAGLARVVKSNLDGHSALVKPLGLLDLPQFEGKTDAEISDMLDMAIQDSEFSADFAAGVVRNNESLAETAEIWPED